MALTDLLVHKTEFAEMPFDKAELVEVLPADAELADGQVVAEVSMFGLTANNLSYAGAGDTLGYWGFFPTADPAWGRIPAWGFATVTRSNNAAGSVGEEIFGYVPMGRRFMLEPIDVNTLCFSDAFEHRAGMHPWYNRYYRTAQDPATLQSNRSLQPVLWALFMTGWEIGRDFADNHYHGADRVLVASASSRTAVSLAKTLSDAGDGIEVVGVTSRDNAAFVEGLGCYDDVRTYDNLGLETMDGSAAFVDMAGNAELASAVHAAFGDRLTKSYRVGATHRGARGDGGALAGPTPEFFFIPDVAEAKAAVVGREGYHRDFAVAWQAFAAWSARWMLTETRTGPEAIRDTYLDMVLNGANGGSATLLTY